MAEPEVDREEFEALLAPLLDRAYGLAYSFKGNPADAEDLLQEAALQAYRGFSSFQPGTHFKAWFFRILTHCHFGHHRRARRRPATVELDSVEELYLFRRTAEAGLHALTDDPAALVMGKLTAEEVEGSIDALPEEYRVVARLHFVEDLQYHEIAELLGCPVGTVRSRLHRGRKMLQKMLWQAAEAAGILGRLGERRAPA